MCCRSWSTETTTCTLETVECGPWARDCVPHTHTHSQTCTHTHRSHACTHTHHTHWHAIEPFQLELCTKFLRFRGSIAIHLTRALSVWVSHARLVGRECVSGMLVTQEGIENLGWHPGPYSFTIWPLLFRGNSTKLEYTGAIDGDL